MVLMRCLPVSLYSAFLVIFSVSGCEEDCFSRAFCGHKENFFLQACATLGAGGKATLP